MFVTLFMIFSDLSEKAYNFFFFFFCAVDATEFKNSGIKLWYKTKYFLLIIILHHSWLS